MPRRRTICPPTPFVCYERTPVGTPAAVFSTAQSIAPGWQRATEILLRGLARLEEQEQATRQAEAEDEAA